MTRLDYAVTQMNGDITPAVANSSLTDAYREQVTNMEFIRGDAVLYIGPDIDMSRTAPWDRDLFAKIEIQLSGWDGHLTLATLGATDTAGFVAALGNWVTNRMFRA